MRTIGDRLEHILEHRGWSARRLGREAAKYGLAAETHARAVINKFKLDPDASVETKTIEALAKGGGCSRHWLETGEGEPNWEPRDDDGSAGAEPANDADAAEGHSHPPPTYGAVPNYAALEKAARRLAPGLDEWVWKDARDANPVRNTRIPLTPSSLAAIARLIAEHAVPPPDAGRKPPKPGT